ncbi:MAG: helix-turn-helix transcriptional regulator, partial [Clostridiales bacterium]|nr:helix-turn-helix transcriptional regulator [Clostridiales bacterium]
RKFKISVRLLHPVNSNLSDTDIPVTDICYQSGFSNVSYFIKCFRKTFGVTPKQYRTQQLANNYCA